MKNINERIETVRKGLEKQNLHGIIIPSNDPHQSESVSDYWKIHEDFKTIKARLDIFLTTLIS